ncbi:hypothetical protein Bca101_057469 [Brassica carinata]
MVLLLKPLIFLHDLSHGLLTVMVFELSIGAACRLMWPSDRLIVQVLDDSTDPDIMVRS